MSVFKDFAGLENLEKSLKIWKNYSRTFKDFQGPARALFSTIPKNFILGTKLKLKWSILGNKAGKQKLAVVCACLWTVSLIFSTTSTLFNCTVELELLASRNDIRHSTLELCPQLPRRHHRVDPATTATESQPIYPAIIVIKSYTCVLFLMAAITNTLGVKLVRLGWSMKNSLVVLLGELSVTNTLDLIPSG